MDPGAGQLGRAPCRRTGSRASVGASRRAASRVRSHRALAKVRADKAREAADGFDGSWLAHPDLVGICTQASTERLGEHGSDQLHRLREDVEVTGDQFLDVASARGTVTREGVRANVAVGVEYLAAWLG